MDERVKCIACDGTKLVVGHDCTHCDREGTTTLEYAEWLIQQKHAEKQAA